MDGIVTVKDFLDALKSSGLLVSVNGASADDYDHADFASAEVTGVTYNSKEVKPGCLFIVKGNFF